MSPVFQFPDDNAIHSDNNQSLMMLPCEEWNSYDKYPLYFEAKAFDNTLEKEPFNRKFSEVIYKKILPIQC